MDGELWDLERPLEKSCTLQFLKFDDVEGKAVYWHSSAHVLGEAAERHYGCLLSHGPPTLDGFFYDMAMDRFDRDVFALIAEPFQWTITHRWRRSQTLQSERNKSSNDSTWTKTPYWRCSSTANTRYTSSKIRSPMEEALPSTDVDLSSISARVHISLTQDESKLSQS